MSEYRPNDGRFAKRLLNNYGTVWLFEVRQGERSTFQVERDERCWCFSLLSQAQAKFEREAARQERGTTREQH
jgi:hypothetical protein